MAKKEEQLYTTGEVAKMFSIKKDTLFYYDKIGLFSPSYRKGNTNYRFYTSGQLKILDTILSMRAMDIHILELKDFLKDMNTTSFLSLMEVEEKKLEDTINEFTIRRKTILELSRRIKKAKEAKAGELFITKEDVRYYFSMPIINTGKGDEEDWNKAYEKIWNHFDTSKIITIGSKLPLQCFSEGKFSKLAQVVSYTVIKSKESMEKGSYANLYVRGSYDYLDSAYEKFKQELEKRALIPISDIFEEYVVEALSEKKEEDYITLISARIG